MSLNDPKIEMNDILLMKREELIARRDKIEKDSLLFKRSYIVGNAMLILLAGYLFINMGNQIKHISILIGTVALYLIVFLIMSFMFNKNKVYDQIVELENEIDLQKVGAESLEKRAEKQFRIHQTDLKRYYDLSLNQSRWIFLVGLICILAGMVIIITTLVFLFNSNNNEVVISVTGGVAGVLTNFIGVIFLKMYSETVKSLSTFHERLVATHHLHFSNFLISKIFNDPLREEAWAKLALSLSKESNEISFDNVRNEERDTD